MYQALYRKYRPKTFDEVIGQDTIVRTLKNSILKNKISHAYLMAGPRGSGKTSIAKIFAKTVNCQNLENCNPCNKCVNCTQSNEQNMDIIEIDAASNNGVDEIREINNKVNLVPSFGKYKIYIIDEVHMLTIGAFNALLKTLEEPPAHVIFILATTDPQKVPITILSRCQRFDCKKISEINIYNRLKEIIAKENIDIEEAALTEISRLGDGSLRDAISILDQVISFSEDKITINDIHEVNGTISQLVLSNLILTAMNKNICEVMNIIDDYTNSGKSIVKITEEIILFYKNVLLTQLINEKNEIYVNFINKMSNDQLLKNIEILNQSLLDMRKFSNPKLILELALIKIMDFSTKELTVSQNQVEIKKQETITIDTVNEMEIIEKPDVKKVQKPIVKESKTTISREIEKDDSITKLFGNFIDRRVNNALSEFSKKSMVEINKILEDINEYVLDEKYGNIASIIMDGKLKAASESYLIYVYKTENLANVFNENIIMIETFLKSMFDCNHKVIAVDNNKWEIIKEKFNSKSQSYIYEEEIIDIKDLLRQLESRDKDGMTSLFGELVEYN